MSARLRPETLSPDELDLILSRHLDGDLPGEEAENLERFLAENPAGRQRFAELSTLVATLKAIPAPAPSFALATRVNARVLDGATGVGSFLHRFGVSPKLGFLFALTGAISLAGVWLFSGTRPASTVADRTSRETDLVQVFIPSAPAKEKAQAPPLQARRVEAPASPAAIAPEPVTAIAEARPTREPPVASDEVLAGRNETAFGKADRSFAPESESVVAQVPAAAPAVPSQPTATLTAVGGGPAAWRFPVGGRLPALQGPCQARYRLTVGENGKVSSVNKIASNPDSLPAAVDASLKSLRLERVPAVAASPDVEIRLTLP